MDLSRDLGPSVRGRKAGALRGVVDGYISFLEHPYCASTNSSSGL